MASPAEHMSHADLRIRVSELEAALEDKEQNVIKAAMFGKSLLEENGDLRDRIEQIMQQHAATLEENQQEVCSLQSRADLARSTERWQQEEISSLKAELGGVREAVRQQLEEDHHREITTYKKQVETLRLDVEHLQGVEEALRVSLAERDALLQSHLDRTQPPALSTSFSTDDATAALVEELSSLRIDLTEVQAKNLEVCGQLQQCQKEKETMQHRLRSAAQEIEDLQCQVVSFSKHLEESRRETMETRAQLDATRLNTEVHSSKGNSIFSELEDRRVVLEKRMASLKVQNQQLKEKYDIEKQQNQKYKMQIATALQMSSQREDPAVQRLLNQLQDANNEIKALTSHIQDLEADKGSLGRQLSSSTLLDKVEDGNYAEYMMAIVRAEKEKATKSRTELQSKQLQYLAVSNEKLQLTGQCKLLQAERDKLQSQLIKTTIEKEEILLKYEPDKVKSGKMQKKIVEKIDMGDTQSHIRDKIVGAPSRPRDALRACNLAASRLQEAKKTNSLSGQQTSCPAGPSGRPSGSFVKPAVPGHHGEATYSVSSEDDSIFMDKENVSDLSLDPVFMRGGARKVSMAEDVRVVGGDGEETVAALASQGRGGGKEGAPRKKAAPKVVCNVKHVSEDNAPEYSCQTQ